MRYGILFEKVTDPDFPEGYFYAHVPSLGLTTHGLGVEGARAAAQDLIEIWIAEKRANNESVPVFKSSDKAVLISSFVIPMAVPMHSKDIPEGTLRSILKQSGLTMDEFQSL